MAKKWDNDIDEDNRVPDHVVKQQDRDAIFYEQGQAMMEDSEWGELGGACD